MKKGERGRMLCLRWVDNGAGIAIIISYAFRIISRKINIYSSIRGVRRSHTCRGPSLAYCTSNTLCDG